MKGLRPSRGPRRGPPCRSPIRDKRESDFCLGRPAKRAEAKPVARACGVKDKRADARRLAILDPAAALRGC